MKIGRKLEVYDLKTKQVVSSGTANQLAEEYSVWPNALNKAVIYGHTFKERYKVREREDRRDDED